MSALKLSRAQAKLLFPTKHEIIDPCEGETTIEKIPQFESKSLTPVSMHENLKTMKRPRKIAISNEKIDNRKHNIMNVVKLIFFLIGIYSMCLWAHVHLLSKIGM